MDKETSRALLTWWKRFRAWITSEKGARTILTAAIILFTLYFIFDAFLRHDNYFSLRLDLGNMDQTVWNVLHGHGFTLTDPMGTAQESRLSVHADFLLILMAPFYLLWSDPRMLIIIQVVALSLGAIPIYWLAKKTLKSNILALMFSVAYLVYPTLGLNALHDFHATSLTTTFFLFAYWYLIKEKPIPFAIFALLAALGKEQFWLVTGMMGLVWIFKPKYRIFGVATAVISAVAFYLLFWKFIPAVTPGKHYWALQYLSEFGGSLNEIFKNIVKHPLQTFASVFAPDRLYYYFQLLSPTAFLSLASPWTLLFAAPNVGINVLSSNTLMRQIDYQYTSGITPWIFTSAIYGFTVMRKIIGNKLIIILITTVALSAYFWGELPYGPHSRFWFFHTIQPEKFTMDEVKGTIPSKYSVSVTNNIGAHFAERQLLYNYPINAQGADYTVILLGDQYAWPSGDEQKRVLQLLLADKNYQLLAHDLNFYEFKRITL